MQLELFPSRKKCKDCGESKDISEFRRIKAGADWRRGRCKDCDRTNLKRSDGYNKCACGNTKRNISKRCSECRVRQQEDLTEKMCGCCKVVLSIEKFGYRKKRGGVVPQSHCKSCMAQKYRERRNKWCPTRKKLYRLRSRLKEMKKPHSHSRKLHVATFCRKLGYEKHVADYISDNARKVTSCQICKRHVDEVGTLHVDHDHSTNVVRGFLCSNCNHGLGNFMDSVVNLRAAIKYLKNVPTLGPTCAGLE